MKDVRKDLDTAALEEGALQADKVLKQAEALAQKKQRLTVKNKSSKPSKKTRRQDQGGDKETTQNAAEVDEEEEGEAENSEEEEGEAEAEETDRSRESDDDEDERDSDDSDVSKDSSQESGKRKRSSLAIPGTSSESAPKRKKVQQKFKLVLAPKIGSNALSRAARKSMEETKSSLKELKDLRSALVALTTLWKQASTPSDKSSCEKKFLALGQSIYNCGVYSEKSGCRADAADLLNKLASLLRATNSEKSGSAFFEIDRLCCDLRGKAFLYKVLVMIL